MTTRLPTAPVDLRSDAVTRPTAAMRRAMHDAEVGDDVLDGDPTARRLEDATAELLGTERALFFPTGTMANQAAVWLLSRRGSEVIADDAVHVLDWECAAAAAICGVQIRPVARRDATALSAADVRAAIAAARARAPGPSLVCVENTHNGDGGTVMRPDTMAAIAAVTAEQGLPLHLDGARLWNAAAALGVGEGRLAAGATSVMVSFSKGLGAPAGAALAGTAEAVAELKVIRKRLGGGMRQIGVLAAGALHGLREHRGRLVEDHARARALADRLAAVDGVRVVPPETNIVMIDLPVAASRAVVERAARDGVRVMPWSDSRVRCVTHLDVDDAGIARAGDVLARALRDVVAGQAESTHATGAAALR